MISHWDPQLDPKFTKFHRDTAQLNASQLNAWLSEMTSISAPIPLSCTSLTTEYFNDGPANALFVEIVGDGTSGRCEEGKENAQTYGSGGERWCWRRLGRSCLPDR